MNIRNIDQLLKPETRLIERAIIVRALQIAAGVVEAHLVFPELAEERSEAKLADFFGLTAAEQIELQEDLLAGIDPYVVWEKQPEPPMPSLYIIPADSVLVGEPANATYEDKELQITVWNNDFADTNLICYHATPLMDTTNTPFEAIQADSFYLLYEGGKEVTEELAMELYNNCIENSTATPSFTW